MTAMNLWFNLQLMIFLNKNKTSYDIVTRSAFFCKILPHFKNAVPLRISSKSYDPSPVMRKRGHYLHLTPLHMHKENLDKTIAWSQKTHLQSVTFLTQVYTENFFLVILSQLKFQVDLATSLLKCPIFLLEKLFHKITPL